MRRTALLLLSFGLLAWPFKAFAASSPEVPSPSPSAAPSPAANPAVDVIKVDGAIDRPMADYLLGSLADAEAAGNTVVIQLNTLGTIGVSAQAIAQRIHDMRVPVIVWVGPPGSHAAGAGIAMAVAASLASVSPGSGIGPADPLELSGTSGGKTAPLPVRIPAAAVHAELTSQQAIDAGVTRQLQPDLPAPATVIDLLQQADGLTVRTAAGDVTLRTAPSSNPSEGRGVLLRYHDLGPWRRVLHAVASPTAVYLLLVLGFAGVAFEFTQPGFGFAGISGLLALGLAAYGMWVVPPNWLGFALLVLGFILMIVDVQIRKLGALTALGMVALAGGSFLLYAGVADAIRIPPWVIVFSLVAAFLYFGFGLTVAQQAYSRIASTQQGLVGLTGEARGVLDPEGAVYVKGTLWRGRSVGEPIPAGTRVRVRAIDGLILRVEPEPEDD